MRTSIVPSCGTLSTPHVIVVGNHKGGSGKSTFAMHIIIALLKAGKRVASFDLDLSQLTLTRYLSNRHAWGQEREFKLEYPDHYMVAEESCSTVLGGLIARIRKTGREQKRDLIDNSGSMESADLSQFISQLKKIEQAQKHDFIVIDTPGGSQHLSLIAHGMADTLITPVNDSFLDLDVLVEIKRGDHEPRPSAYAKTVRRALDARRSVSGRTTDWIVVRNRLESAESSNHRQVTQVLDLIRTVLDFRIANGLMERTVYREFFASGLTALDQISAADASAPLEFFACAEVQNLIRDLGLIDSREGLVEYDVERELDIEQRITF
jgi:chromosome partitioning protein